MDCHECKQGMLDLAYGLLEPSEAAAVQAHSKSCPDCSLAMADAGRVKNLLGRAAKFTFHEVTFDAPLNEVAMPKRPWKRVALTWTVAAAALLGVIALPPYLNSSKPGEELAKIDTTKADDRDKGIVAQGDIREGAGREWTGDAKSFRVKVLGPKSAIRGSEYSITATDANGQSQKVRVTLLVMTGKTPMAGAKKAFETDAKWTLTGDIFDRLPEKDAALHVLATHPISGEKTEIHIPLR